MSDQLDLFSPAAMGPDPDPAAVDTLKLPDQPAREYAVDPRNNVVLEASAGTGKTTVLVDRYVNLLQRDVDPRHILAITFTRKAAAEMRERIIRKLKRAADVSAVERARWNALRDRLTDIDISTIDAFCLSLLREFPLEADLDPAFAMADETEVPRLVDEALDRALRVCLLRAREDDDLALVLAQLGLSRARAGLAHLLQRRLVAQQALDRFLAKGPDDLQIAGVCRDAARRLQDALAGLPGGLAAFLADGPVQHPRFRVLARQLERIDTLGEADPAVLRGVVDRVRQHFLTQDGRPRRAVGVLPPYRKEHWDGVDAFRRHRAAVEAAAPRVAEALAAFARDLNVVLARGVRRMFWIARNEYRRTLDERSVLDFSDVLEHAIALLRQMDEFSQSRFRLEARYHHVLVDEFQDTSRAQWQLVSLLIEAWGQGSGLAGDTRLPPSIFVVGDRKQSIYGFRDAEVSLLHEAGEYIAALRPGGLAPRRSISYSFRARPPLLAFVNDLFAAIATEHRPDAFEFGEQDRFPLTPEPGTVEPGTPEPGTVEPGTPEPGLPRPRAKHPGRGTLEPGTPEPVLGPLALAVAETPEGAAAAVADEIARLIGRATVRDRDTGVPRPAQPGDVAILFRSRASHREVEEALEARGIPAYVYKGLGFFDADEIKDLLALLRFLAAPASDIRAAAFLRSRFVRLSDEALQRGVPALFRDAAAAEDPAIRPDDRARLARARASVAAWLALADRIPPAELLDSILAESAYDYELRGPRRAQARENVKKMRTLIRRIQNRGYATLGRIAEHLDSLSAGDESNATLEAVNAVNLMTVHAAKGLEFPVVFVVNLAKGASGPQPPVRVVTNGPDGDPSVSVASYISEADEEQAARELEETKRLLYVALTRARDALYLVTVLKDGEMRPGRGSLGEVLPDSIRGLFSSQVAALPSTEWRTPGGATHVFRIVVEPGTRNLGTREPGTLACPAAARSARGGEPGTSEPGTSEPGTPACPAAARSARGGEPGTPEPGTPEPFAVLAFDRLPVTGDAPRLAVTRFVSGDEDAAAPARAPFAPAGDLIVGTLVHRLFQAAAGTDDRERLVRRAASLLRPDERAQLDDERATLEEAATMFVALARDPDVAAIVSSGACEYEVPFAVKVEVPDGPDTSDGHRSAVLRGTIDCVVRRPDGSLHVLEFKTGRPKADHHRQLEIYLAAVRAMFPGTEVRGSLVYP